MAAQPPKIDPRTYEDIVEQTKALVQKHTASVEATVEQLRDRTLAEAIVTDNGTLNADQLLSVGQRIVSEQKVTTEKALKKLIEQVETNQKIKVQNEQIEVDATLEQLRDCTLAEDIVTNDDQLIAAKNQLLSVGQQFIHGITISTESELKELIAKIQKKNQKVKVKGWRLIYETTISTEDELKELIAKIQKKNQKVKVKGWRPGATPDAGLALIRIFGRMAKLVSDRLNQVPEKNFLAFLDLIGTRIAPPQPARVPLTFTLVEKSPEDALVLAKTQIAAPATETQKEVVFELERDLVVVRSQLKAAFIRRPDIDHYNNQTATATGANDTPFKAFGAETPIPHHLYLACDDIFTRPGKKEITLTLPSSQGQKLRELPVTWSYWNTTTEVWEKITEVLEKTTVSSHTPTPADEVTLILPTALTPHAVNGHSAAWIRAQFESNSNTKLLDEKSITLKSIKAKTTIEPSNLSPNQCFFNTVPLDLSKPFYPFGEQPKFNDTFYIASREALSQTGATVTLKVTFRPGVKTDKLALAWEYWNSQSRQWSLLDPVTDNTQAFTNRSDNDNRDQVTFKLPDKPDSLAPTVINGEDNYWIRVRITQGSYGEAAKSVQRKNPQGHPVFVNEIPVYEFVAESFNPPIIESIALSYSLPLKDKPVKALTYNDFIYSQLISENASFKPFTSSSDTDPALYLGFDRPFPNRPVTLYAQVEPLQPGELTSAISDGSNGRSLPPPQLIWEYYTGQKWQSLGAIDETGGFTDRGLIRFIGPTDWMQHSDFGQTLYWLRVRWAEGNFLVEPRLQRLLTNTAWASSAVTLNNEVLGSSTGNPNQTFFSNQYPILPGEQLEVEEVLPPLEKAALAAQGQLLLTSTRGGSEMTRATTDTPPEATITSEIAATTMGGAELEALWVRWQEVLDFYSSNPNDRHYRLNRLTGEIQFGDGLQGKVPPLGQRNIRFSHYRSGGSKQENRLAHTVRQLKTTIPYVDGVTNYEAASGASDQESLEQVKERGPKKLRHHDRAVTAQDIEDLAFEASPEIARARAISPAFKDDLAWLPAYLIPLDLEKPLTLTLTLTWQEQAIANLVASVYGPGQSNALVTQSISRGTATGINLPPEKLTAIKTALKPASTSKVSFRLVLSNPQPKDATNTSGSLDATNISGSLEYPNETQSIVISKLTSRLDDQPVSNAGQIDLVIVPRTLTAQPTPTLGLVNQVETYIRSRCSPTMALYVTEPRWIEVTIVATLVPTSLQESEDVRERVLKALNHFLHPLTGGATSQGWNFGRFPRQSDIYAVLSKVKGVDHIKALQINMPAVETLPKQFLIYSGSHSINLDLS